MSFPYDIQIGLVYIKQPYCDDPSAIIYAFYKMQGCKYIAVYK